MAHPLVPVFQVALAVFAVYVLSGNDLEVSRALTALALFDLLRFPLFMLPGIINRMVEAGISVARIRSFLLCDEHHSIETGDLKSVGVKLTALSCAYESSKPQLGDRETNPIAQELLEKNWEISLLKSQLEETTARLEEFSNPSNGAVESQVYSTGSLLCLKHVDFEVKPGELVAVVGGVGCGKSSLLNAILGEVRKLSGSIEVQGSLAFFSQNPFVLNETLKANILFCHVNEPVDEEKYQRALDCCALRPDLAQLPAGDQTEIGERGITLSGGQRARIALARAVYHGADISLIDDALAAVDAHVAKHLFEECIVKELLGGDRSVVLATNAIQHLNHPRVNKIVVVRDGRVVEQGTFAQLSRSRQSLFSRFLAVLDETGVSGHEMRLSETKDVGCSDPKVDQPAEEKVVTNSGQAQNSKLMTVEERSIGHVDVSVYLKWATAAGGAWLPFVLVLAYGSVECIGVGSKWWLTYWSGHGASNSQVYFLAIYAVSLTTSSKKGFDVRNQNHFSPIPNKS